MERLRANKTRSITILFLYSTFASQILWFLGHGNFSALIFLIIFVMTFFHAVYLLATKGFDEDLYFSKEGIEFKRDKGKHFFEWSNIIVIDNEKRLVDRIFPTIRISDRTDMKKCEYIPLSFPIRESLKELLKRYCPQENILIKEISLNIGSLDSDK